MELYQKNQFILIKKIDFFNSKFSDMSDLFQVLPAEILQIILNYLSLKELINFKLVGNYYRNFIENNVWDHEVVVKEMTNKQMKRFLTIFRMTKYTFINIEDISDMTPYLSHCKKLNLLESNIKNPDSCKELKNCETVKIGGYFTYAKGLDQAPKCREIILSDSHISPGDYKNLKNLYVYDSIDEDLIISLKHLEKLVIVYKKADDDLLEKICSSLTNLKHLSIYGGGDGSLEDFMKCRYITNKGTIHLKNLKNLIKLNLYFSEITEDSFPNISELKNLKCLGLDNCGYISTLEGLDLPNLEKLCLNETSITDKGLMSLVNFPKLKRLEILECENLTNKSIDIINKTNLKSVLIDKDLQE